MPLKYIIQMAVSGASSVVAELEKITKSLDSVRMSYGFMQAAAKASDLAENMFGMAGAIYRSASLAISGIEAYAGSLVSTGSLFEDAESSLKFAFKDGWRDVYSSVLKDSADLTFTFKQTVDLAAAMGRMHINPFGGAEETQQLFLSRNGEMVRALTVWQDLADTAGKDTQDVVFAVRNALAGSWRPLQERFDIPVNMLKKWKSAVKAQGTDIQKAYNVLVANVASEFGGATAGRANNFSKILVQIPDLIQQLEAKISRVHMPTLTAGLKDLVKAITDFRDSKAIEGLTNAFGSFADMAGGAISRMAGGVRTIQQALEKNRNLLYLFGAAIAAALALSGALTVGLAAAGTGLLAFGAVLSVVAGVLAVGVVPALLLALGAFASAIIAVPILVGVMGGLAGSVAAVSSAIMGQDGPLSSWMAKWSLFAKGAFEFFKTFDGKNYRLADDTLADLQKRGLISQWGEFTEVLSKSWLAFEAVKSAVESAGSSLQGVFLNAVTDAIHLGGSFLNVFGVKIPESFSDGETTLSTFAEKAEFFAASMIISMGQVIQLFDRWIIRMDRAGLVLTTLAELASATSFARMKEIWQESGEKGLALKQRQAENELPVTAKLPFHDKMGNLDIFQGARSDDGTRAPGTDEELQMALYDRILGPTDIARMRVGLAPRDLMTRKDKEKGDVSDGDMSMEQISGLMGSLSNYNDYVRDFTKLVTEKGLTVDNANDPKSKEGAEYKALLEKYHLQAQQIVDANNNNAKTIILQIDGHTLGRFYDEKREERGH